MLTNKPYNVTLDAETVRMARELGHGNLSAGLRHAVTLAAYVVPTMTIHTNKGERDESVHA